MPNANVLSPISRLALTTLMVSVACALGACVEADSDPEAAEADSEAEGAVDSSTEQSTGRMPPETIQHVVRSHFDGFRACWDGRADASIPRGTVRLHFVIDRDGSVRDVKDAESDLPEAVVACVARKFEAMTFPEPTGGVISVTYPIAFSDR